MRISDWSSDVCSSDLLPFFKANGEAGPGQLPIHRERIWRPVGLDDAFQRRSPILRTIARPLDPKIHARRCTEQVAERKGHDATAKMRTDMGIGITCKYKLDLVLPYPAAPAGGKARQRKHVPAVLIGNHQRQAAVRKTPRCVIHPLLWPDARPQIRRTEIGRAHV